MPKADPKTIVAMTGIVKRFDDVIANDGAELTLREGEIHAVVGENGAGKTTLMSILYGMHQPDAGEIEVDGARRGFASARDAIGLGIGMVHQHFMLAPSLSAAQNIVLGYEPGTSLRSTSRDAEAAAKAVCDQFGMQVVVDRPVGELTIGMQQRVEILKALHRGARIPILDEPTAVLAPREVDELFIRLRAMRDNGLTIVFISHKLREVMAISDRVTVMRRARTVATVRTAETTAAALAQLMIGTDLVADVAPRRPRTGEVVLRLAGAVTRSRSGSTGLRGVDLSVHAGEIVGIAAIEGNGQSDLLQASAGVISLSAGTIELFGRDYTHASIADRRQAGLGYVPEDRHLEAMTADATAAEIFLSTRRPRRLADWLKPALGSARRAFVGRRLADFDIRPPDPDATCRSFSGGNQQKLVFARELATRPKCLLLGQPTRGVDVGASSALMAHVFAARDSGSGILLVSADLDELFAAADRIVTMFEGAVTGEFDPRVTTQKDVGPHMTGAYRHAA
jgi:simple sugar transport system ATP-binding protein